MARKFKKKILACIIGTRAPPDLRPRRDIEPSTHPPGRIDLDDADRTRSRGDAGSRSRRSRMGILSRFRAPRGQGLAGSGRSRPAERGGRARRWSLLAEVMWRFRTMTDGAFPLVDARGRQVPHRERARALPRLDSRAPQARRPDPRPHPRDDRVPGVRGARDPRVRRRPRGERAPGRDAQAPQRALAGRSGPGGPRARPRPRAPAKTAPGELAEGANRPPLGHHPADGEPPSRAPSCDTAGIEGPQACPRGLRHSYGVAAVTAGVPLPTIAAVLGHASLTTTAIYTTAIGAEARELVSRVWA